MLITNFLFLYYELCCVIVSNTLLSVYEIRMVKILVKCLKYAKFELR